MELGVMKDEEGKKREGKYEKGSKGEGGEGNVKPKITSWILSLEK
jgi:hypothetical protein